MGFLRWGIQSAFSLFTPAWQSLRLGGGGALQGMHTYADGTILTHGDVFGGWVYKPTGSVTQNGTTYTAPAWQILQTTDSLPVADTTIPNAYSNNTGVGEVVAAPSNTLVLYMYWNGKTYVSTNRGASWTNMGFANGLAPNAGPLSSAWIAVDPNNQDIVYFMTPSGGVFRTTGGTTGGSIAQITGIPASLTNHGGAIYIDNTSTHPGNVTQRVLISVDGQTGVYESTTGGTSGTFTQRNTGTPPTNIVSLTGDTFGQLWAAESFRAAGTQGVFKYASGTWSFVAITGGNGIVSAFQDTLYAGLVANNQIIVVDSIGQLICSTNNGTSFGPGQSGNTIAATGAQPGWLGVANQFDSSGNLALSINMAAQDPSGTVWAGTGINTFSTPDPIVSGTPKTQISWVANTIGQDMLVTNQVVSPPGSGPLVAVWDRGVFLCKNPDVFPSSQFPNSINIASPSTYQDIQGGWSVDYVPGTPATVIAGIASQSGGPTIFGISTDGANTWSLSATQPSPGITAGAVVAASTTANFVCIPGSFNSGNAVLYRTGNGGSTWTLSTISGNTAFIAANVGYFSNKQPLCADRVTAGTFYVLDINQKFFSSTDGGVSFTPTGATSASVDATNGRDFLLGVPGNAGHVLYSTGGISNSHLWKSTNGCASFAQIPASGALQTIKGVGMGAPIPGGGGYPVIYVYGQLSGVYGLYQSNDAGVTWIACNIPGSELWPFREMDAITWISGDMNVYGRVYVGLLASGATYIDTADACPWVNFSNINPNDDVTGTITLTAKRSGLVPLTSVQFSVDGANIGSPQTGAGPYSVSWVTGGVAPGAHVLKVTATGANGSGSFSIPIKTH